MTLDRRSISHMSRIVGAVAARRRLALALTLGGAIALLMPSLLATTGDAPSAVVLVAVVAAVAAVVGLTGQAAILVAGAPAPQPRTANVAPGCLAGRATDPAHHPLRPRAPGLV
jgi:hypothetical protein